ncbi:MAG: UDP-N-acetylmuramoyl-tripeptide--D-alanyl-D-alanine ligase [Oscillospiraceae bacterium]|nr:UDP-N-acetylmuramoyl-tripeptide--D-alanyl-D-alanine ligase [Oscillospiraceae bacterium]
MARISLEQAAAWCGGRVDPKYARVTFEGANIDSRKLEPGQLFVALVAARDGHDFIPGALEKGAAAVLCNHADGDYPAIVVEDTRIALGRIAAGLLKQMDAKIIGVTGSVGKSTTKEMIAAVLGTTYKVCKTPANHNNDLGLPAAVLAMDADAEALVLEMGMSHFGEIEYLSCMAKPHIGVIINIGTMHIENLGSQEGILRAKLEITKGMDEDGKLLLYGDDAYLWGAKDSLQQPVSYFGTSAQCAVRGEDVRQTPDGIEFTVAYDRRAFPVHLPLEGMHYVSDALAAVSVGLELGVSPENIQKGLGAFQTMQGRQEIFQHHGCTVISDCYNAGPESMAAALHVLGNRPGRKIAVLGDMLELGDHSQTAHTQVGQLAAQKADILLCFGPQCAHMLQGALQSGMTHASHYTDRDALADDLLKLAQPGDVVLFKGSRGMKMELILEKFTAGTEK